MFKINSKNHKAIRSNSLIFKLSILCVTICSSITYNILKLYNNLKVYKKYIKIKKAAKVGMFLNIIVYYFEFKYIPSAQMHLKTQINPIKK